MKDACETIVERLEQYYLPKMQHNDALHALIFNQEVSGNVGTVFTLDLGRFTQYELVHVFELVVGLYNINEFAESVRERS